MKITVTTYKGWVINTRSAEGHGLIGRYWWFEDHPPNIPKHLEGHETALFETRKEARRNLPGVRKAFPRARVERVVVDISVQK